MTLKAALRFLLPWILLGVLGGILFILYALSTNLGNADRNRTELIVRQTLAHNTQIDFDVLRLRHRQLLGYDSITATANRVATLIDRLDEEFAMLGQSRRLDRAKKQWQEKMEKLDDFKRQNSVLVNSLYHFINIVNQFQARGSAIADDRRLLINAAIRNVLIFVSEQQSMTHDRALESINRLESSQSKWQGADGALSKLLAAHGHKILDNHLPVQELLRQMADNSFVQEIGDAYAAYLSEYALNAAKAERYRRLMAIFALIMIIAAMAIVLRLQQIAQELAESHSLLSNIADHLSEGILGFNGKRELMFINREAEKLLERPMSELIGQTYDNVLRVTAKGDNDFSSALLNAERFTGEIWLKRSDGSRFPALFMGGALPSQDGFSAAGYVTSFRDITEQYEAEARLRLAARVFDNLSEAMTVTGADGRIQSVNPAFAAITGYSEDEVLGCIPGKILGSGQHGQDFFKSMWSTLKQDGKWRGEIINRRKNGELFPEWLSITAVRSKTGKTEQYIALFSDISDRKQAEAHIHHLAYYDPLTSLANRMLFHDRLNTAIHQAHRTNRPLAVMYLDLDRFKSVNDSLGHKEGDNLLKEAGRRLEELAREGDTVARFSGDEFAVLLSEVNSLSDVSQMALDIVRAFEMPFVIADREIFSGASIGIALYPNDADNADDLLKHADVALYHAKNEGGGTYLFFSSTNGENHLERLELETALRHAVDRGELRLFYQPQVSSKTQKIYGVEALVRWQHPQKGLIPPDRFISLAESIGYIDTLGIWCLETACRQFVQWRKEGHKIERIAVNVSAKQLRNENFIDTVLSIINKTDMPIEHLELELTESSMTDNPEKVLEIFMRFRQKGIRIAIDDFGTGYSSLSYLVRFPVDVLKIDKSFVQAMGTANDSSVVVRTITVLAHSLSMEIVAEGVETEQQRDALTKLDVELLQGFLYSRPVPSEKLVELACAKP
ncbi:MAG: EAL domain-containing protein [Helicobacteraceae bacterium]|jgi:diguanylate cyclase (GGDEF)-like protein/PAS domain S-box-containing protein|nr:EAL domain-containing protein [Helicobacteraceae bacterium]